MNEGGADERLDEGVEVLRVAWVCVFCEEVVCDKGKLGLGNVLFVALCGEFLVERGEDGGDGFFEWDASDDGVDEHDQRRFKVGVVDVVVVVVFGGVCELVDVGCVATLWVADDGLDRVENDRVPLGGICGEISVAIHGVL